MGPKLSCFFGILVATERVKKRKGPYIKARVRPKSDMAEQHQTAVSACLTTSRAKSSFFGRGLPPWVSG